MVGMLKKTLQFPVYRSTHGWRAEAKPFNFQSRKDHTIQIIFAKRTVAYATTKGCKENAHTVDQID
jgi:hypothetical protein